MITGTVAQTSKSSGPRRAPDPAPAPDPAKLERFYASLEAETEAAAHPRAHDPELVGFQAEGRRQALAALEARREAIERGIVVSLTLDPAGARYRADSVSVRGAGLLAEGEIALDEGVSLATDSARVRFTFRPDGSVFGDSVTVHGQWSSSVVSLDRWTGAIRIDAR